MIRKLQDTFVINLTQDQRTLVDEKDWYELKKYKWHAQWNGNKKGYYAVRSIPHPEKEGKQTTKYMHRSIMGLKFGDKRQVDHINGNTLDNRRENLRVVSPRQNQENRKDQSKYGIGVYYMEARSHLLTPYMALAHKNGKLKNIGCYSTPEEAQEAREQYLKSCEG